MAWVGEREREKKGQGGREREREQERERERLTQCFNLDSMRFIFGFIPFLVTREGITESQVDELHL
jgi:hypothetical protein